MTIDHEFPESEYVPELGGQQASLQTDQGQYKRLCVGRSAKKTS